jgi:dTDP-4-amino-4,6-dideoxygalactose transaminase
VVEDAAQAVGAEYCSRRVGSFGEIGCFSLHPLKTLNACGDSGVMTTNDPQLAEKLKILRNIGLRTRDDCVVWSSNSRLDTLQAAILLVKLRYFDAWTEGRRQCAAQYQAGLQGIPNLYVPQDAPHEKAVYHTFVIQCDRRDDLRAYLADHSIGSHIHYPVPIHLSNAGRELGYPAGSFPVAERQATRILSLPVYQELTNEQIDEVCATIRQFYA